MATILRFQPADLLQCRFAVSPLGEVTDALRFLGRAARHATPGADGYHLPWQRQVRSLLAVTGIGGYVLVPRPCASPCNNRIAPTSRRSAGPARGPFRMPSGTAACRHA